jgi:4-amino-4-deoxy-L-arabinose transferase-like glycosyltransferase
MLQFPPMRSKNILNSPLFWILAAFIALALIYAWATPPLEASDELWHFGLVNHIADTGQLPVQVPGTHTAWEQEGSQPPLYYLSAAALVKLVGRSDFMVVSQPNPHAIAGIPGAIGNKNLVLHDTPHPALQGTMLAIYVLRFFGIILGCVTVAAVYKTALCITNPTPKSDRREKERRSGLLIAVIAAGLTAFNPMFLFITASVNNDNLVIALNSLVIWQTMAMLQQGFDRRRSIAIAVFIALASLSKLSGLVLVPIVGLSALWIARKHGDWRGLFTLAALMAAAWLALAGWWFARNMMLYGELFGTRTMAAVAGQRLEPFTIQTLLNEFEGFRAAYWGWFGAVNITTVEPFYRLMDIVTVLALVGLIIYLWERRHDDESLVEIGFLALTIVIGGGAVIAWTAQTYASQGRLLFPFLAAISPLLAIGLSQVWHSLIHIPRAARLQIVSVFAFALFALAIPFGAIAPQYALPDALDKLPDSARPVYARFGDLELVGYDIPDQRYLPGDTLPVTVYWHVLEHSTQDLSLYLHAVGDSGQVIGKVDSYPGAGRLRTTTWQPGAIYADTYAIPLDSRASGNFKLRVQVGWWDYPSGVVIQPTDEQNAALSSVMLDAGGFVGGEALPAIFTDVHDGAKFGDAMALSGYVLEDDHLSLIWEVTGTPDDDYTVFVQVLNGSSAIVGQGDAPPALPTHYWRDGEHFVTQHTIVYRQSLTAGTYRILVGWYRPGDFLRLNTDSPNNAYLLTTIEKGN